MGKSASSQKAKIKRKQEARERKAKIRKKKEVIDIKGTWTNPIGKVEWVLG